MSNDPKTLGKRSYGWLSVPPRAFLLISSFRSCLRPSPQRYTLGSSKPHPTRGSGGKTYPTMPPIVHVNPNSANASVELVSSVMSPIAALTTATFPLRAPARDRKRIIVQKFWARPLKGRERGRLPQSHRYTGCTHNRAMLMQTPARPSRMTGFLPIRLRRVSGMLSPSMNLHRHTTMTDD